MNDAINPSHYKSHPSGVEAIEVCQHLDFCLGNAVKYLWRAGKKGDFVQDLEKSAWYFRRTIENRKVGHGSPIRSVPNTAALTQVIASESEGSVLRDVLDLVVQRYASHQEPRLADALARVEREIEMRRK